MTDFINSHFMPEICNQEICERWACTQVNPGKLCPLRLKADLEIATKELQKVQSHTVCCIWGCGKQAIQWELEEIDGTELRKYLGYCGGHSPIKTTWTKTEKYKDCPRDIEDRD